jgi:hypothetical protein
MLEQFLQIQKVTHVKWTIFVIISWIYNIFKQSKPDTIDLLYLVLYNDSMHS